MFRTLRDRWFSSIFPPGPRPGAGTATILLVCAIACGCDAGSSDQRIEAENSETKRATARYGSYELARESIARSKEQLRKEVAGAKTGEARDIIMESARVQFVEQTCRGLIPFWYGTDWDFNGTTEKPGRGMIACGYFVSTILKHSGIQIHRVRLAQQASEHIIQSLVEKSSIQRFSGVNIDTFLAAVREEGPGLFIVGLDRHVGFLLYDHEGMFFIHSSAGGAQCVMKEKATESSSLGRSRYRVLGAISHSDKFIGKWLRSERFTVALGDR